MLSLGFMHAGQSNRKSRWKWFLINSSVLILTWNFVLDYLLLSDFADWGCFWVQLSWQLGHTFGLPLCRGLDMGFFFFCILDSTLFTCCDAWMSELAGNGCDWHRAAQDLLPDKSQLPPRAEILKTTPNIGATAGNCSFFLYRFSTLSQVPQGCGYSKTSGRPKVTYAWNVRICEKIFPNMSRGESDMTVPWVGKKWTPLQSDLWINTMSPRDLNLLWNF